MTRHCSWHLTALALITSALLTAPLLVAPARAQSAPADVGQIKLVKGAAHIEREGQKVPATVGAKVRAADVVVTGADGAVGIAFLDDSLLSIGPRSTLAIERFAFDSTTHQGGFESSLRAGTLSIVSGKIAKQSRDAMRIKTPAAVLGVRGTELLVRTSPVD